MRFLETTQTPAQSLTAPAPAPVDLKGLVKEAIIHYGTTHRVNIYPSVWEIREYISHALNRRVSRVEVGTAIAFMKDAHQVELLTIGEDNPFMPTEIVYKLIT